MKDLYAKLGIDQLLKPQVLAATDTSVAVDLQGFKSAIVIVNTGAIASSGNFTTKMQESDTTTDGDFTDVVAADLHGSFPAVLLADSVFKVGYKGAKRYIRTVTTKNSGTSIAAGIVAVKGAPSSAPVA